MQQPADPQHSESWRPCAPGELATLSQRPPVVRRAWVAWAILLVVAVALLPLLWPSGSAPPAALDCGETRQLMPRYASGGLQRQVAAQVEDHLRRCEHCRQEYENLR